MIDTKKFTRILLVSDEFVYDMGRGGLRPIIYAEISKQTGFSFIFSRVRRRYPGVLQRKKQTIPITESFRTP